MTTKKTETKTKTNSEIMASITKSLEETNIDTSKLGTMVYIKDVKAQFTQFEMNREKKKDLCCFDLHINLLSSQGKRVYNLYSLYPKHINSKHWLRINIKRYIIFL